jgi:hypothetical protein
MLETSSCEWERSIDRMNRDMKRWTVAGILAVSVAGSLMHFAYEWSGGQLAVGLFAPVNESIWEHFKLLFWPALSWWLLGYLLISQKEKVPAGRWFCSAAAGLYSGLLFITAFYYTYTGAFGFHSLFFDILLFVLGTAVTQLAGLNIYSKRKAARSSLVLAAAFILLLVGLLIIFTFSPPQIPLFEDPITGSYGI